MQAQQGSRAVAKTIKTFYRPFTSSSLRYDAHTGPHTIVYTKTDEAPALATVALLPVLKRFCKDTDVHIELSDISVANRVLSLWSDKLKPEQQVEDNLAKLGELAKTPEANIIKLPNVSASVPQLTACIAELQQKGYDIPDYPQAPANHGEEMIKNIYSKVLGSAVNPVLREGNSDRRAAAPVKEFAQNHPKKMGAWDKNSKTHIAHMTDGDFYGSEKSYIMPKAGDVRIEFVEKDSGKIKVLKEKVSLLKDEVIDASFMDRAKLTKFVDAELEDARKSGIMVSLHLKATMMKVSDPKIFGTVVTSYYKDLFDKHGDLFTKLGVNVQNGFGDVVEKIQSLPADVKNEVEKDIEACYAKGPKLAMVSSTKTNLHVPSDVIIDASMPNVIRDSGGMWNKDDKLEDTKCIIPDRCYATSYQTAVDFVKENGQFDAGTMGHTSNVGLMAQKAEEYGSHDKTFELENAGMVRVVHSNDNSTIFEFNVNKNDIWRMCQTKDIPIRDWVKLAVTRARNSNTPAIFWLDENRAHDKNLIGLVNKYLEEYDTSNLDISIMPPAAAMTKSMERAKAGKDTISVTGNVLRDYNTDLFPILELGTSAKMLSIVPLLAGGGLYETGAGGSAPKHVEQLLKEGHLRWDSLGEYLATAVSLEELGLKYGNEKSLNLGQSLNEAVTMWLNNQKSPSRKVNELDNRGSSFYLTLYWAQCMAKRDSSFVNLAKQLEENEAQIAKEFLECQGQSVDIGGYYMPENDKTYSAMRPSALFNSIIDA